MKKAVVLTEMVGYNCFIIFQYYYLNIKILKFYENWNFLNFENFIILKSYENFEFFFEIFEIWKKIMKFYENYIVNLPEMTNRQNSGVIFRFGSGVLLRQRVLLRSHSYTKKSYWGMSNAYYPIKLTDFCMKYDQNKYCTCK